MQYGENDKTFYHNDAEASVLGSFFINERAVKKFIAELTADDFANDFHRAVFTAMSKLARGKGTVDLVTVDSTLTAAGHTDHLGKLVDLTSVVPSAANVAAYIRVVKEKSMRRRVRDIAQQACDAIHDPTMETEDVVAKARQDLRDIAVTTHGWVEMPDLMLGTFEHLERVHKGEIKPIKSGISQLDKLIGGFFPGEMTAIGARPGVGKSALALHIGENAARAGKNVCVVSLEMSQQQFGQRLYSKGSKVNGMKLRNGDLDGAAWTALSETMQAYSDLPMSFLFTAYTIEDIITEVQRKADSGKLDMLIVDYLQLVKTRRKFESERLRVGHISHEFKQLSKDLRVPVLALAQLRRPPNQNGKYVPGMSDLKESGDIEADADGIILLHRVEESDDPGVDKRDARTFDRLIAGGRQYILFNVDKQRQGSIGSFPVIFDPAVMEYITIWR